jgi:hypothetical protein
VVQRNNNSPVSATENSRSLSLVCVLFVVVCLVALLTFPYVYVKV